MGDFKVLVWNCGGLRATTTTTQDKLMFFEKEFKKDFQLAIFIETHQNDNEQRPQDLHRYNNTHRIVEAPRNVNETYTGITMIIHKDYKILNHSIPIKGRISNIEIENQNTQIKYNIIAIYNYTLGNLNPQTITQFTDAIKTAIKPETNNILTLLKWT